MRGAWPMGPAPRLFSARRIAAPSRAGSQMVNPFQFIQEVRAEAKKVTWPTQRETLITTGLVILMVVFASLFFVIVDSLLRFGVGVMLRGGF
jgi:preprotein translocase subunit SecE